MDPKIEKNIADRPYYFVEIMDKVMKVVAYEPMRRKFSHYVRMGKYMMQDKAHEELIRNIREKSKFSLTTVCEIAVFAEVYEAMEDWLKE